MLGSRFLKSAAMALLLLAGSFAASAQTSDYQLVKPPQPGGQNGQIEVIEFFSYGCPHCNDFDPFLAKWRAEQPKDVVFKRVPVSFGRPEWDAFGRIYLTLNAMGLSDKLDSAVFRAIHVDRIQLDQEKARNEWLTKQGVDVRKFDDTMRSFSVNAQSKRADQQIEAYKIMAVPSMVVNGKYMVEGGDPRSLATVSKLVAQERAAHPAAPAAVEPAAKKSAKK